MRLRNVSYALKAVAEVARAGDQLVDSLDRSRSGRYLGSVLLGVGLGVALGAVLFSESARESLRGWLTDALGAPPARAGETAAANVAPAGRSYAESASPPH